MPQPPSLPPPPSTQYVGVPPLPAYVSQQHGQFVNQYQHEMQEMRQQMELMKMENYHQLEMLKMQNKIIIEKLNSQAFLQIGMQQYHPPAPVMVHRLMHNPFASNMPAQFYAPYLQSSMPQFQSYNRQRKNREAWMAASHTNQKANNVYHNQIMEEDNW